MNSAGASAASAASSRAPGRDVSGNSPAGAATSSARSRDGLLPRIASSVVLVPLAIGTAYAGGWLFAIFWGAAALVVAWEWSTMAAVGRLALAAGLAALALAGVLAPLNQAAACGAVLLGAAAAGVLAEAPHGRSRTSAWAAPGVLYAGAILTAPAVLRADAIWGFVSIIFLFAIVWATDICGYFVGRWIGGPKLWSVVSPKKTWSGAIGGALGALAAGVAVAKYGGAPNLLATAVLALLLSAVSQAGDLFESAIKRRFGVKDASHVIPGHGGIMDRLDGFVAAAVLAAMIGIARGGLSAPARGLLVW